jgi:hypothetical protein
MDRFKNHEDLFKNHVDMEENHTDCCRNHTGPSLEHMDRCMNHAVLLLENECFSFLISRSFFEAIDRLTSFTRASAYSLAHGRHDFARRNRPRSVG